MNTNNLEIERKFLIKNDDWKKSIIAKYDIEQHYLSIDPNLTVRIRKATADDHSVFYYLTIKSKTNNSRIRNEVELMIGASTFDDLRHLVIGVPVSKTRHIVANQARGCEEDSWEVDVFHGQHEGLVLAEIELIDANYDLTIPDWVGEEVTNDARYTNSNLADNTKIVIF